MKGKRVAVIGAGPCGLPAIKCCLDEGLDVVCFEKTGKVGGLWRYHEEDIDGVPSVMKCTVINTSKELSCYSDFPMPKEFPNYLPNDLMLKYFEMYSDNFGLERNIKFHNEVVAVTKNGDYEENGNWDVSVKDLKTGQIRQETFDGVLVCSGHHTHPRMPRFPEQEKFRGRIMHTHSLKTAEEFKDKRVLVIGVGNSGLDAATDICTTARQVYISTRRGSWIVRKTADSGMPADGLQNNRLHSAIFQLIGWKLYSTFTEKHINNVFDHELYGLKPNHRIFSQHTAMNDSVFNYIMNGKIVVKRNVVRFVEDGVVFEGEQSPTRIDAVIMATGYDVTFPFLSKDIVHVHENKVSLYKFCFPGQLTHPTLAIIGLTQVIGCIFPLAESQSRWFAQLMLGKVKMPSRQAMLKDIQETQERISERYVDSPRHTLEIDYVPYMDDLASHYGAKPNLAKYLFSDLKLFWALLLYPCMPYQYRLTGPKPWPKARETILTYPERVAYPLNGGRFKLGESFFHPSVFGFRIWKELMIIFFIGLILIIIIIISVIIKVACS